MKNKTNINIEFFKSAIFTDSAINSNLEINSWLERNKKKTKVSVMQVPINKLRNWVVEKNTGNIHHESGRFFSIEGIRVSTDWGLVKVWEQPIIIQPEIGILGILTKKINGVLHFLMQAKIEPGNINQVQISPTLQATKSNYTRVHNGRQPLLLEYFNGGKQVNVLLDQLQSEQGGRFFRKRNRNIIIQVDADEDVLVPDNFIWMTLGQIKNLMRQDNLVNMDTRTVISGITFGALNKHALDYMGAIDSNGFYAERIFRSIFDDENYLNAFHELISWITGLKSKYELNVERIPLKNLRHWVYSNETIYHEKNKYFSVIGVNTSIAGREVVSWDQPMIKPAQEGLIGFIIKPIGGVLHFLVQAKLEVGNIDTIELAPTVQCLTGNYRNNLNEYNVPFIDTILNASQGKLLYSAMQSEEGGRFYYEQNRNVIVIEDEGFTPVLPENYCWMTYSQMLHFLQFNNYFNIAARSLMAAYSFLEC
jgi:oxidase EvaA